MGLDPNHIVQLENSGQRVGHDIRTRGFRYADGQALLRADVATAKANKSVVPPKTPGLDPCITDFGKRPRVGTELYWHGRTSTSTKTAVVEDSYFTVLWPPGTYTGVNMRTVLPAQMILAGTSHGGESGSAFLRKNPQGQTLFYGLLVGKLKYKRIVACPVNQFAQAYYLSPL